MKQITRSLLLLIAVCFLGGILAPAGAQAAKAKAKPEQTVGYVNRQQVFASYPGIQDIMNRIQTMRNEAQQDYDTRSKDLPEAERQALNDTIAREEARKEDNLMKPVGDKIEASIKAVAEEKGLTVIIDAATVVYGGIDITADVIAKLKQ
ncbi:OmpH family outer membrane protein [Sporomusa sphaeroides]|uniref:Outer membrane protein (OmpH-like) n=1 Tax=Sporomusa sphaeroides DSM 2875 TaxID=1337886 RepID=A0ABP2C9R4_9FIRM|nr:OmpH family outer membrane protein [Sporomusa sphaeroides]OLS55191.1 outer membrane protein (OmpH-like) [Sporomusa sphaeroides DSM 2875]CVK20471.1 Outer membrane protein (OmpH-like) [Sporomusa sphaeroides DSM 2875]